MYCVQGLRIVYVCMYVCNRRGSMYVTCLKNGWVWGFVCMRVSAYVFPVYCGPEDLFSGFWAILSSTVELPNFKKIQMNDYHVYVSNTSRKRICVPCNVKICIKKLKKMSEERKGRIFLRKYAKK